MSTPILNIPEVSSGVVNAYLIVNAALRSMESAVSGFIDVDLASSSRSISEDDFLKYFLFNCINNAVTRTITVPAKVRVFGVANAGAVALSVIRGTKVVPVGVGEAAIFFTDGSVNGLRKFGGGGGGAEGAVQNISVACSDEVTGLSIGVKVNMRMPYSFTLSEVRASLSAAQISGSLITVDIKQNGASILSVPLTFDNGEKTSLTAASQAVISASAIGNDSEITFEVTQIGDGTAKGLKVYLIGSPS